MALARSKSLASDDVAQLFGKRCLDEALVLFGEGVVRSIAGGA